MNETRLDKPLWESALQFWFNELTPKQWFVSSKELDQTITDRFSQALHAFDTVDITDAITEDYLAHLNITQPLDTLGAILITDQFSRNIHRGHAKAFATDAFALSLSRYLINTDSLSTMTTEQIQFAIMPHMHAENLTAQITCVDLFKQYNIEHGIKSAIEHQDIIEQFGRFPHRNNTLGRSSSVGEIEYLKQGNSFGQSS